MAAMFGITARRSLPFIRPPLYALLSLIIFLFVFPSFIQALCEGSFENFEHECVSHQDITRTALDSILLAYWPEQLWTPSMFRGIEEVVSATTPFRQPKIHTSKIRNRPAQPVFRLSRQTSGNERTYQSPVQRLMVALDANAFETSRFQLGRTLWEIQEYHRNSSWHNVNETAIQDSAKDRVPHGETDLEGTILVVDRALIDKGNKRYRPKPQLRHDNADEIEMATLASEQFIHSMFQHLQSENGAEFANRQMRLLFGLDAEVHIPPPTHPPTQVTAFKQIISISDSLPKPANGRDSFFSRSLEVGSTITALRFTIKGEYALGVYRPDRTVVASDDANAKLEYCKQTGEVRLTIVDPLPGLWELSLTGQEGFRLEVAMVSSPPFAVRGRRGRS
jgi:hypothetical protein